MKQQQRQQIIHQILNTIIELLIIPFFGALTGFGFAYIIFLNFDGVINPLRLFMTISITTVILIKMYHGVK